MRDPYSPSAFTQFKFYINGVRKQKKILYGFWCTRTSRNERKLFIFDSLPNLSFLSMELSKQKKHSRDFTLIDSIPKFSLIKLQNNLLFIVTGFKTLILPYTVTGFENFNSALYKLQALKTLILPYTVTGF